MTVITVSEVTISEVQEAADKLNAELLSSGITDKVVIHERLDAETNQILLVRIRIEDELGFGADIGSLTTALIGYQTFVMNVRIFHYPKLVASFVAQVALVKA